MTLFSGNGARWLCIIILLCQTTVTRASTRTTGQFLVFGTRVDVTVINPVKPRAVQAINALEDFYRDLHRRLHPWLPGPLADLNTAISQGRTSSTEPLIIDLIKRSQVLSRQSGGRFDPAIGKLVALWGFHRPAVHWQPPARQRIAELVAAHPEVADLHVKDTEVSTNNPDIRLDFGAIAKGYAVDAGLELLRDCGINTAMINAGGDLGVIGQPAPLRHWRAAIKNPEAVGNLASLVLFDGETLATSGDYERFHRFRGKRYAHLLDPHTGWPETTWTSVTVLSSDGASADAAATALALATIENWQQIASNMGIDKVMLVRPGGKIFLTLAMRQRVNIK